MRRCSRTLSPVANPLCKHADARAETGAHPRDHLRRERDLGHEQDGARPVGKRPLDQP